MTIRIACLGFGEAAAAFAAAWRDGEPAEAVVARAYDIKTDVAATAAAKRADYARCGVGDAATADAAVTGADAVLSLVTAGSALTAARAAAASLARGALFLDMNSVAPTTKRLAAEAIERAGGRYVDVAVLAPVHPTRLAVPILVSGLHGAAAAATLSDLGFSDVGVLDTPVGAASAIKMIRSVVIKGLEALTAECFLAAEAADVTDEVIASLDRSPPPPAWEARADYNLDRMLVHGRRRAEEMREVVKTLEGLGTPDAMTRATVDWQDRVARAGAPPPGLAAKLALLFAGRNERAA